MNEIRTRILVGSDHLITGVAPSEVPPGEHLAVINIPTPKSPARRFRVADLPVHRIPWDGSVSLRREDLYGDDGR